MKNNSIESTAHPGESLRALLSQAGGRAELNCFQMLVWIPSGTMVHHSGENPLNSAPDLHFAYQPNFIKSLNSAFLGGRQGNGID